MHRDRAWRRAQRERSIQRVYRWMRDRNWYMYNHATDPDARHQELWQTALIRHSAPKLCSGWCCGNPRKHFDADKAEEIRFSFTCEEEYSDNDIRINFSTKRKRW